MTADNSPEHLIDLLSAALDEIYFLRQGMAYEAAVVEAHLSLKSFPKSRRKYAEEQIERMRAAVTKGARETYPGVQYLSQEVLRLRFKPFTRFDWEQKVADRGR